VIYPKASAAEKDESIAASPRFPAIEEQVLAYWDADGTFRASVENRSPGDNGDNEFVFYDGPPFANGLPHYGHLLTGYVKDLVPRYQTMRGRRVERRFGWDTHGLPAELEAMRQLGIKTKDEIENVVGIAGFNQACRESVLRYTQAWRDYVTRQARWADFGNDYKTLDLSYMESVMWAFKQLHEKGLAYEGFRCLPYCWNDETPLSAHELRMDDDVYQMRRDPAVTVGYRLETGELALIWTTTPWTLPSNLAMAVHNEIDYVVVESDFTGALERYVLAEARLAAYARELGEDPRIVRRCTGKDLTGLRYTPPFSYFTGHPNSHVVLHGDFVTTADGTGIVHIAPAFGEDDKVLGDSHGITPVVPVGQNGTFIYPVDEYSGLHVFDANAAIISDLKAGTGATTEGTVLLRRETYEHSYPHCWRCRNPLIYMAVSSWFVATTKIRDRMLELNEQITWVPEHVKHGQFGKWLENTRDWSISRNRYWGTPIPVWKSDNPAYPRTDVYGSVAELQADFGVEVTDLHRPAIDELTRPNPDDPSGQSVMRRVTDVLDCWFESGSMSFAQVHYPFENAPWFQDHFPGDFIVEYIGQTRGWFYTMHVLAAALFDRPAFKTCVSHGIVLGSDRQKMSKSLRNYPDVNKVFDRDGADAMRWFLMSSPILRGGDLIVTEQGIRDGVRQMVLPLWNSWYFFQLYANAAGYGAAAKTAPGNVLDRYLLAKLRQLTETVQWQLDHLEVANACAEIRSFVDVLTNWYIRRSRERFWDTSGAEAQVAQEAFDTLYTALEITCRVTAPLLPLISEEIWRGLTGGRSVHLTDWPDVSGLPSDPGLVTAMDRGREVCSAAASLRKTAGLRVRLPLSGLTVVADDAESLGGFTGLIADEVNVREVTLLDPADTAARQLGVSQRLTVNPRALGPRLGRDVQQVIKASKAGDWSADSSGAVTCGGFKLEPGEFTLDTVVADGPDATTLTLASGGFIVLNTSVTPDLAAEGLARDVIRAVQQARRAANLGVSDRITLTIAGSPAAQEAMRAHEELIATETLATSVTLLNPDGLDAGEPVTVGDGEPIRIRIEPSPALSPRRPGVALAGGFNGAIDTLARVIDGSIEHPSASTLGQWARAGAGAGRSATLTGRRWWGQLPPNDARSAKMSDRSRAADADAAGAGAGMPALPAKFDLPAIEHEMLARWNRDRTFDASLKQTEGAPRWTFYEGPPTANGMPGVHHIEARVFKDLFPRFKTMQGFHVRRKGGWDCHGLPVEVAVEKELGLSGKKDIETYGVAEFNERCRESVLRHVDAFAAMTERMGYWIDLSDAYRTMDPSYIQSVWWSLKVIYDKGLLVRDFRISPYCPRCGTALSDHEMGQPDVYREVRDPSVTVRFPLTSVPEGADPNLEGADLLVWTTTPWTLVSNTAVAVHPEVEYAIARRSGGFRGVVPPGKQRGDGDKVVVAERLFARVLGEGWHIVSTVRGAELLGARYQRPFGLIEIPDAHVVVPGSFVTTEDGTGLVHLAPAFGADDMEVSRLHGLPVVNPVRADGKFEDGIELVGGMFFKDADRPLLANLADRGLLFHSELHEHSYPHCWRCGTPLLYYALPSWYIRTTAVKDQLLAENEETNWQPPTIKHGRYGEWLRNNVDWALSRTRYWGTPLPVWECPNGHDTCVGSLAELGGLAGTDMSGLDPHRPYVDDVTFPCPSCGLEATRVPEVIDAWYDSGSMPFAQHGAPFRNEAEFESSYPAQFICEAIDQTRGWFYSLMAVGTLVFGRSSYENVVCLGLLMDERGRKMSKHLGNVMEPMSLMEQFGADAVRWFFAASGSPWAQRRIGPSVLEEITRKVLLTYWNTVSFLALYANASGWTPGSSVPPPPTSPPPLHERPLLDRWLLSEVHSAVRDVTASYEAFDSAAAGRRLAALVDDLSNWYVRRSRRRFWDGPSTPEGASAFATLHEALVAMTQLMAPVIPFLTDYVWGVLRSAGSPESVHLSSWPGFDESLIDGDLSAQMALTRRLVELGRSARASSSVRTRQPLARALVGAPGFAGLPSALRELVMDELNVHSLSELEGELVDYTVKPNFRSLGSRFGSATQAVALSVSAADADALARAVLGGGTFSVDVPSVGAVSLSESDVIVTQTPRSGWAVATDAGETVALDVTVTPALRLEGLAREVVRLVQDARKSDGLDVTDRIVLRWAVISPELEEALTSHGAAVAAEVLAVEFSPGSGLEGGFEHADPDLGLRFWLRPVPAA
jgi:isoleucyl-tRNA synthetase